MICTTRPARSSLAASLLMRAFGRPQGLLGRLGGVIMARGNRPMAERAIRLLEVEPGDRVLEIGFGPGVAIERLVGLFPSVSVAGIDPSREMLEQASARNAHAIRAGRVELRQGSAEALPYADATFDKALAINSLQVWSDVQRGLREVHRVLKRGGRLALGFTRRSLQKREGLPEALQAAGFPDARIVDAGEPDDFCVIASRTD